MTLHQLRIFVAVAKRLNVTKASQELHITQPAVSRQLKLLSEAVGAILYEVTSRGIELTAEGRLLLRSAVPVLAEVERIKSAFDKNKETQPLRVGGSEGPSASLLPLLATAFRRTHPKVPIVIRTDLSHAVEELVLQSKVEIAVFTAPSFVPALVYEPCRQEKLVAFTCASHSLVKKQKFSSSELSQVPLVIKGDRQPGDFHSEEILSRLEECGITPGTTIRCDSPWAIKAAVKAGVGIGLLHRDMVEPELKHGELKIVKIADLKLEADSYIVYGRDRPLSANAQAFLALLRHQPARIRYGVSQLKPAKLVEYR